MAREEEEADVAMPRAACKLMKAIEVAKDRGRLGRGPCARAGVVSHARAGQENMEG